MLTKEGYSLTDWCFEFTFAEVPILGHSFVMPFSHSVETTRMRALHLRKLC